MHIPNPTLSARSLCFAPQPQPLAPIAAGFAVFEVADLPADVIKIANENIARVVANSDCKKLSAPQEQACSLVRRQGQLKLRSPHTCSECTVLHMLMGGSSNLLPATILLATAVWHLFEESMISLPNTAYISTLGPCFSDTLPFNPSPASSCPAVH